MRTLKLKKGIPMKMDPNDNPTFEEWMARIDKVIYRKLGLSVYDLIDQPYRDWYDSRLRPIRAVNRTLKNN